MCAIRRTLHDAIGRMDEQEAREAQALIRQWQQKQPMASVVGRLAGNPALQLAARFGEPFSEIEPLLGNGASAAGLLVAVRR